MKDNIDDMQSEKLRALGALAGGVAHDLNNILAAVLGHVSLLRIAKLDPSLLESVDAAELGLRRAAKLTKEILDFARKKEDDFSVSSNICTLIHSSIPMVSPSLPENITISLRLQEREIFVNASEAQLTQILLNLIVNARDAMPQGGNISVSVEKVILEADLEINGFSLKQGPFVRLSVTDQGHGIPQNIQAQIFDPFFTTKRGTGTGIGLATVFSHVKTLNGAIDVVSEVDQGTTFDVYIPYLEHESSLEVDVSEVKVTKYTDKEDNTNNSDTSSLKKKILVVDDEDAVRLVLQRSLEILGYEVVVAENGNEALKKYEVNPESFSLVIMDMIMPIMPGDELFFLLKGLNPEVNILISSGYSSDGKTQHLLKNGAKGFIQKPFAIDELSEEVKRVLS